MIFAYWKDEVICQRFVEQIPFSLSTPHVKYVYKAQLVMGHVSMVRTVLMQNTK
jgi:hypothetical protein